MCIRDSLNGFRGTIQTDAYAVYQALITKQPGLTRIGCLAHARRRFYEALKEDLSEAVWCITQIRSLYQIEDEARDLTAAARQALRQQRAPAIWAALKAKTEALRPTVLPKSTMGKAISYFLDEYDALIGYLRDGRFEIDNNLIENSIRPTAVGRSYGQPRIMGRRELACCSHFGLRAVGGGPARRHLSTNGPGRVCIITTSEGSAAVGQAVGSACA